MAFNLGFFQVQDEILEALFVCKSPSHPTFLLSRKRSLGSPQTERKKRKIDEK